MSASSVPAKPPRPEGRTRDHLANERTFLAWIRTALGLIGLGFVLARMGMFLHELAAVSGAEQPPRPHVGWEFIGTGLVLVVAGTVLGGCSAWIYRRTRIAIDQFNYEPASNAVAALTVIAVGGGVVIVCILAGRVLLLD